MQSTGVDMREKHRKKERDNGWKKVLPDFTIFQGLFGIWQNSEPTLAIFYGIAEMKTKRERGIYINKRDSGMQKG